jgi:hypothetical protein
MREGIYTNGELLIFLLDLGWSEDLNLSPTQATCLEDQASGGVLRRTYSSPSNEIDWSVFAGQPYSRATA